MLKLVFLATLVVYALSVPIESSEEHSDSLDGKSDTGPKIALSEEISGASHTLEKRLDLAASAFAFEHKELREIEKHHHQSERDSPELPKHLHEKHRVEREIGGNIAFETQAHVLQSSDEPHPSEKHIEHKSSAEDEHEHKPHVRETQQDDKSTQQDGHKLSVRETVEESKDKSHPKLKTSTKREAKEEKPAPNDQKKTPPKHKN